MTSALERRLRAAGRPVESCPECGVAFDPSVDYAGHKGAPRRATCSTECRRDRDNRRARELRAFRHEIAALRTMHDLEASGQLPLPTAADLPALPAAPAVDPV